MMAFKKANYNLMTSWQSKIVDFYMRKTVRTRKWGNNEAETAKRAKIKFGLPKFINWLHTRTLKLNAVNESGILGEWVETIDSSDGVIFYIHGGAFISCSAETHRPITASLAKMTDFRVFSVNYRLAPKHRFPAALDDCVDAYKWLLAQGIPANKIAVTGDSAGGNLVLTLLLKLRESGIPIPACGVCLSPLTDMKGTGKSKFENEEKDVMFYPENLDEFAPIYLGDESPDNPFCSPLYAELNDLPPMLIQASSTELLLDDSKRLHENFLRDKGESKLTIYENVAHDWHMMKGFMPEADEALKEIAEFTKQHIK